MTIVNALKKLLTAMGGTPESTDNQTITEVLADIYMLKAETTGVKFDTIGEAINAMSELTWVEPTPDPDAPVDVV